MQNPALKYITLDEYFAMEEAAVEKHEYYQGEVFAMAGASQNHHRISLDLGTRVNLALSDTPCEAYAEMRLWIKAKNLLAYPDLMIVCGKAEFYEGRDDTLTNPLVIFEVLSESTKDYDRGEKFEFYCSIPAFQEYILIDQHRIHVEQMYRETPNKWIVTKYNQITDILKLAKVDAQIALRDIYRRVQMQRA